MAVQPLYNINGYMYLALFEELHFIMEFASSPVFLANPTVSDTPPAGYTITWPLSVGSCLVWTNPPIYLYVPSLNSPSPGTAYLIGGPQLLTQYQFNTSYLPVVGSDEVIANA